MNKYFIWSIILITVPATLVALTLTDSFRLLGLTTSTQKTFYQRKNMTNNTSHKDLIEKLKNPTEANIYFEAVLKECKNYSDEDAKQHLLEALKNISAAQPDVAHLDLSKENFKLSVVLRVLNYISKKLV